MIPDIKHFKFHNYQKKFNLSKSITHKKVSMQNKHIQQKFRIKKILK